MEFAAADGNGGVSTLKFYTIRPERGLCFGNRIRGAFIVHLHKDLYFGDAVPVHGSAGNLPSEFCDSALRFHQYIVNQPRGSNISGDRDQSFFRNPFDRIERVRIDQLEIVERNARLADKHFLANRDQFDGDSLSGVELLTSSL